MTSCQARAEAIRFSFVMASSRSRLALERFSLLIERSQSSSSFRRTRRMASEASSFSIVDSQRQHDHSKAYRNPGWSATLNRVLGPAPNQSRNIEPN